MFELGISPQAFQTEHQPLYIAVGPAIANVHVYLEHLVSPSDDLTYHVPEKRDRYLFGSHAEGSRFLFLEI
jgi:hypothetical protein